MPTFPVEERINNFAEVDLGFTQEQACSEAHALPELRGRGIGCGPVRRVSIVFSYVRSECPSGRENAEIDISQCQSCGICAAECPASAIDVGKNRKGRSSYGIETDCRFRKTGGAGNFRNRILLQI